MKPSISSLKSPILSSIPKEQLALDFNNYSSLNSQTSVNAQEQEPSSPIRFQYIKSDVAHSLRKRIVHKNQNKGNRNGNLMPGFFKKNCNIIGNILSIDQKQIKSMLATPAFTYACNNLQNGQNNDIQQDSPSDQQDNNFMNLSCQFQKKQSHKIYGNYSKLNTLYKSNEINLIQVQSTIYDHQNPSNICTTKQQSYRHPSQQQKSPMTPQKASCSSSTNSMFGQVQQMHNYLFQSQPCTVTAAAATSSRSQNVNGAVTGNICVVAEHKNRIWEPQRGERNSMQFFDTNPEQYQLSPNKKNVYINKKVNNNLNNNIDKKMPKKFMSSAQIEQLHQHSMQSISTIKASKSPSNTPIMRRISANQIPVIAIPPKGAQQSSSRKQVDTPKFLVFKKKSLTSNSNSSNSNQVQLLPRVLKINSQVCLRVITQDNVPNFCVLKILRVLADNGGTTVYLVLEKTTHFLFCLKKSQIKQKLGTLEFQFLIRQGKVGAKLDHPSLLKTYCTLYDNENIYQLMQYMQGKTLFDRTHHQRCNMAVTKSKSHSIALPSSHKPQKLTASLSLPTDQPLIPPTHSSSQSPQSTPSSPPPSANLSFNAIHNHQQNNKIASIRLILTPLLQSVAYLHKNGIVHRDIKPSNIFISHSYTVKLGDFGSSGFVGLKEYVGTLDYVAPEVLLKNCYDYTVDMWSLGCLAYQLYTGIPPFFNQDRQNTMKNIILGEFDKTRITHIPLLNLITLMLQKDKNKRISAEQALQHPFIDYINKSGKNK